MGRRKQDDLGFAPRPSPGPTLRQDDFAPDHGDFACAI
jgi:hypothetical protein